MKKIIAVLVILAIIGALIVGISAPDIIKSIIDFVKNLSVWIFSWVSKIPDILKEVAFSYTPK